MDIYHRFEKPPIGPMITILFAWRPIIVCLMLLALAAAVQPVRSETQYLVDAPGTWKAWKPFSAISSVRIERGATPAEVKAFEATLLDLNAILRRAPGVATPHGYSVETWGSLLGLGPAVSGRPAGKSLPLAGSLDFGAFPIFEYDRNGKTIREDSGEAPLMIFEVNEPWIGSSRKPEEWGAVDTDAFLQPRLNGELAGLPRYGDMLIIAKSPEKLWLPVTLSAAIDLVTANRRVELASFQQSLDKFKARLAIIRDPVRQAQRMKEAKEASVRMPNPEEFIASIAESIRIEEASVLEEISPKGGTGKGLVETQRVLDGMAAWLAELSATDRAAPACYVTEAKELRAKFRPGFSEGCVAIVKPNYQYFNPALPRSAPQVLSISPVAECLDSSSKYNEESDSKSPAGCSANRRLIETMDKDAIRAWLR
jgi:hypothetical protein